jgi:hypothetical protein
MSKRIPSTEEQIFAERLRCEAFESRPEFSESLHRRIAGGVRQFHAHLAVADRTTTARHWGRGLAAALAAACLLCAAAIAWQYGGSARRPDPVSDAPTIADAKILIDQWTDQATVGFDGLVASATLKPQTAQLKRDARLVAHKFLEPLPVDVKLVSDP